jgi:caffeoyl-CoA O-methyltransferase
MTVPALRRPDEGPKSFFLAPEIGRYLVEMGVPPDPLLRRVIDETVALTGDASIMQIAPEQGQLLTMLCRMIGATRAIEVGTFTGYSSLCILRGLAPGDSLVTIDHSAEWTAIARGYWEDAGVAAQVDLRVGSAREVLAALPADSGFDFAFLDADKPNYHVHYEALVTRLRPGGVLVVDNVLWGGRVLDRELTDTWTVAIRAVNARVAADARVDNVMLPVGDGISIVRKR